MNKKSPFPKTLSAPKKAPQKKAPAKKAATKKAPAKKAPAKKAVAAADPLRERIERVRAFLDGKKGENVVVLHVAELSGVCDYMVLCTGLNGPHLRALADEIARQLRLETPPVACHKRAGSAESEWLVLDYADFVVHLFTPNTRAYYAIEQLWKDAPVV
jgi:ribosome-associated protein